MLRDRIEEEASSRAERTSIFVPGRNCWRVERAGRAAALVDSSSYFLELRRVLPKAQRSIFIVGWDFDSLTRLDPRGAVGRPEDTVGGLIEEAIAARADLQVYILIWNMAPLVNSSDLPALVWGTRLAHPRIHVKLDGQHPLTGSQHQKLVCIDDAIAFCGGIDITSGRWDEPSHELVNPLRLETTGKPYHPVHDLQMTVDGKVAAAIGEIVRDRWRRATGAEPVPLVSGLDCWPSELVPDWRDVDVAIARTDPPHDARPPVREAEALNIDAITRARKVIYLETQYFSAKYIVDLLCEHLGRPDGPEIIVVATRESHGWIEHMVMSRNRDRHLARLRQSDRYGRFRAFFPATGDDPAREIVIHSKLVVIDDWFLRLGSSNMNNRSRGLDSECDLAIEASSPAVAHPITALRDRLLAEHVGAPPELFASEVARLGSVIAALESLNNGSRRLCPFERTEDTDSVDPLPGTALLDPDEPISLDYLWRAIAG